MHVDGDGSRGVAEVIGEAEAALPVARRTRAVIRPSSTPNEPFWRIAQNRWLTANAANASAVSSAAARAARFNALWER